MFCSKCGTKINDGERFCSGCGTPVAQNVKAPIAKTPLENTKNKAEQPKKVKKPVNKKAFISVAVIISIVLGTLISLTILNAIEKKEIYNSIYYEWEASIPEKQPKFLNALDEVSSFECVDIVEESENYFIVTVITYSPNILADLNAYQQQMYYEDITEDEINEALCDIIYSAPIKTAEHNIYVVKDGEGNYHVNFSESFVDAMFDYAYMDATQTLNDELEEIAKGA